MKAWRILTFSIPFLAIFLQGCIHEYPKLTGGPMPGEDPTLVDIDLEVTYDLSWENLLYHVDFTRTDDSNGNRGDKPHRFIFEVKHSDETVCRDIRYLSDTEFNNGSLRHHLSVSLKNRDYDIAVWYDMENSDGEYSFEVSDLKRVKLNNFSTSEGNVFHCAYAGGTLDLRDFKSDDSVTSQLQLAFPGARYEIVATDIQQFITEHKEDLNQEVKFRVNLSWGGGACDVFDAYTGQALRISEKLETEGNLRLPFAEYDELKIAEGFLFCDEKGETSTQLSVINSALSTVSRTERFQLPIRRGYITTIYGDFLLNPIDGFFSINHIWEGEIVIEI